MKPFSKLLTFFFFSLMGIPFAIAIATDTPNASQPEVQIVLAESGLFNPPNSGSPPFVPSKTVPLVENQAYGWIIVLKTNKPKIKWREEFTLPSAPATWGDGESQGINSVSEDRRVSITERDVSPIKGLIFHSWAVAPGDPKGRYVMRVIIDDSLEQVFEFDVQ